MNQMLIAEEIASPAKMDLHARQTKSATQEAAYQRNALITLNQIHARITSWTTTKQT